ncbi:hypothetical protein STEG23_021645, partial [Scotinomys teguina]
DIFNMGLVASKVVEHVDTVHIYMQMYVCSGALTVGLVRQCQTIHGRDRTCIPPRLPPEWVTTLFFIIMGIISLTVTCGLLVASHWRREATKYARWIAFTGNDQNTLVFTLLPKALISVVFREFILPSSPVTAACITEQPTSNHTPDENYYPSPTAINCQ